MININDREWNDLTIEDVEKQYQIKKSRFSLSLRKMVLKRRNFLKKFQHLPIHMVDIFLWGFLMKKLLLDVKNGMNKRFIL